MEKENQKTVVMIGAFPPSRLGLSEYVYNLATQAVNHPNIKVIVLADKIEGEPDQCQLESNIEIVRCWEYNKISTIPTLYKKLKKIKPDLVWWNLIFTSFANKKVPAFLSLFGPMMSRYFISNTIVTLHQIIEAMDSKDSFVKIGLLERIFFNIATRIILQANLVYVLMENYAEIIRKKYNAKNIRRMPHGFFPFKKEFAQLDKPKPRIMIFGKFGTYKKVERAVEIFEKLKPEFYNLELFVAGTDNPSCKGYMNSMKEKYHDNQGIIFPGYIAEEDLERVFSEAAIMMFPYTSSTGSSGVAHLCCSYGVPIVSTYIEDIEQLSKQEGFKLELAKDDETMLNLLREYLTNFEKRGKLVEYNKNVAREKSFSNIFRKYLEENGIEATQHKEKIKKAA